MKPMRDSQRERWETENIYAYLKDFRVRTESVRRRAEKPKIE